MTSVEAYGLHVHGLGDAGRLLVPSTSTRPSLRLSMRIDDAPSSTTDRYRIDRNQAHVPLRTGGHAHITREPFVAELAVPNTVDHHALVHPLLALPAIIGSWWFERLAFHAGAFAADGGAYGVIGDKGAGKSTTLACLSLLGVDVLSDDLVVADEGHALAGPACIDLRREAAEHLHCGEYIGLVGDRERWRHEIALPPPSMPLAGWVFLAWGERVELVPVAPAQRLERLLAALSLRMPLPTRSELAFLELAALPAWELRRPRGWGSLDVTCRALLDHLAP